MNRDQHIFGSSEPCKDIKCDLSRISSDFDSLLLELSNTGLLEQRIHEDDDQDIFKNIFNRILTHDSSYDSDDGCKNEKAKLLQENPCNIEQGTNSEQIGDVSIWQCSDLLMKPTYDSYDDSSKNLGESKCSVTVSQETCRLTSYAVKTNCSVEHFCSDLWKKPTADSYIGSFKSMDELNRAADLLKIHKSIESAAPDVFRKESYDHIKRNTHKISPGMHSKVHINEAVCKTVMQSEKILNQEVTEITNCGSPDTIFASMKSKQPTNQSCAANPPNSVFAKEKVYMVNLYIEGKNIHFGPHPILVSPRMTVRELKELASRDLNIKPSSQKWILGKNFVNDDSMALSSYGVVSGSFIYLYVDSSSCNQKINPCSTQCYSNANGSYKNLSPSKSHCNPEERCRLSKEVLPRTECNSERPTKKIFQTIAAVRKQYKKNSVEAAAEYSVLACSREKEAEAAAQAGTTKSATTEKSKAAWLVEQIKTKRMSLQSSNDSLDLCAATKYARDKLSSSDSFDDSSTYYSEPETAAKSTCEELGSSTGASSGSKNYETVLEPGQFHNYSGGVVEGEGALGFQSCDSTSDVGDPACVSSEYQENAENERKNDVNEGCLRIALSEIDYNALLQFENMSLIPNVEDFDCPVCLMPVTAGQGVLLQDCLHGFCKECLAYAVIYSSESFVRCPFRDESYSCSSTLQQREIKALVSDGIYEQFLQRSLVIAESLAEKSFHCLTADCPGWCFYEDNVNIFLCPVCSHYNCLTCQAIHEGLNCRQYQDNLRLSAEIDEDAQKTLGLLEEMIKQGKALKCPRCCVVLMKKWGCDWLKCSVCQTEVCWITKGPRWGPGGRGDTSGGCKCGVDGKKCHISCTYCH